MTQLSPGAACHSFHTVRPRSTGKFAYDDEDGQGQGRYRHKNGPHQLLNQCGIPCVAINLDLEGPCARHVISDNYGGALQAMQYLIDQGHRNIGLIGHRGIKAGLDRCQGYVDSLNMFHLPVRQEWMTYGGFWEEDGYTGALTLLACRERPSAVFCVSDMQAIGAMRAFEDAGLRIGDDISIVGFDDIMMARYIKPGITTVRQDKRRLGELAAEKMIQLIDGTVSPVSEVVPTDLVVRGSVGTLS